MFEYNFTNNHFHQTEFWEPDVFRQVPPLLPHTITSVYVVNYTLIGGPCTFQFAVILVVKQLLSKIIGQYCPTYCQLQKPLESHIPVSLCADFHRSQNHPSGGLSNVTLCCVEPLGSVRGLPESRVPQIPKEQQERPHIETPAIPHAISIIIAITMIRYHLTFCWQRKPQLSNYTFINRFRNRLLKM